MKKIIIFLKKYEEEIKCLKSKNNELTNKLQLLTSNDNPTYENNPISYIKIIELIEEIKKKNNEIKKVNLNFLLN